MWNFLIVVAIMVAVTGLGVVIHRVQGSFRPKITGTVAMSCGVTMSLFLILLAVLIAWGVSATATARQAIDAEVTALRDAYWSSENLPADQRTIVRQQLREYSESVAEREWPRLAKGRKSPQTEAIIDELRGRLSIAPTGTPAEQQSHVDTLNAIRSLQAARQERVGAASGVSVLLIGSTVAAGLLLPLQWLLVGWPTGRRYIIALALAAGVLTCSLLLGVHVSNPFRNDVLGVTAEPFRKALVNLPR